MAKKLRILLTNSFLSKRTGSETFLVTIADELRERGHTVMFYGLYGGELAYELEKKGYTVFLHPWYTYVCNMSWKDKSIQKIFATLLSKFIGLFYEGYIPYPFNSRIKKQVFDIVHYQHQSTIVSLSPFHQNTPCLQIIHGVLPKEEQPLPTKRYKINKFIAVSEEIQDSLATTYRIDSEILRNPINISHFSNTKDTSNGKKILIISKKIASASYKHLLDRIKVACINEGYELSIIGHPIQVVPDTRKYIQEADIVIGIGRCAYEAMAMGKNVIVCDYLGLEGMITSEEEFLEFRKHNLSGRLKSNTRFTVEDFQKEIRKYSSEHAILTRKLIEKYNDVEKIVDQLVSSYFSIIEEHMHEK